MTKKFDQNRQEVKAEINKKIDQAKSENQAILDKQEGGIPLSREEEQQLAAYNKKVENYQQLGVLLDVVTSGLSSPTSSGLGIAASSLSPVASYEIGQYFKEKGTEGSSAHILAHTVLGAAVAAAGGNDALTAGLVAGGAEAAAPALSSFLYNKKTSDLTADEKSTISAITGLVATGIGGIASGGDIATAVQSGQGAQNAVENNNDMSLPFPVNNGRMSSAQSLVEYGIQQGWSNEKIQAEVNRDLRGKGIEIENKDIVEVLDKSGKAATIIGIYPVPQTKPFAIVGGALGTASILVDDKKTWGQKAAEIIGSAIGSKGSTAMLNKVPVSEGVKNTHNAISGEIGGKAVEATYKCIQNPKQSGC